MVLNAVLKRSLSGFPLKFSIVLLRSVILNPEHTKNCLDSFLKLPQPQTSCFIMSRGVYWASNIFKCAARVIDDFKCAARVIDVDVGMNN